MNFLEISLKTEYTSVPAHLKIYCSDELVFDNIIDKSLLIKKQFETPKVFTLKIIKTPKTNPNYYFDTYQRKGDIYNKPNTDKVHKNSWEDLRNIFLLYNILQQKDILIYNYNSKDNEKLDNYFEKKDINELKV